ncbi:unnamed protein product [Bemisia tabaci]|uniref:Uncharacterized protein n=1 Tax=Bemisia tabaci TaxID=7038 RepID=A0A9P0AHT3_BEMTA|nr:unnamed protein product [Bemisia tabaci]
MEGTEKRVSNLETLLVNLPLATLEIPKWQQTRAKEPQRRADLKHNYVVRSNTVGPFLRFSPVAGESLPLDAQRSKIFAPGSQTGAIPNKPIERISGKTGQFVFKEIALILLDGGTVAHFLMKPPHSFAHLSRENRKQVSWLERRYHEIPWNARDMAQAQLDRAAKRTKKTERKRNFFFNRLFSMSSGRIVACATLQPTGGTCTPSTSVMSTAHAGVTSQKLSDENLESGFLASVSQQNQSTAKDGVICRYISHQEGGAQLKLLTPGEIGYETAKIEIFPFNQIVKEERMNWWRTAKTRARLVGDKEDLGQKGEEDRRDGGNRAEDHQIQSSRTSAANVPRHKGEQILGTIMSYASYVISSDEDLNEDLLDLQMLIAVTTL